MNGPHRVISIVLAVMLLSSSSLLASGGGGGEGSDEGDGETMVYITIGLVVLVGGLLLIDVLTDSGEEEVFSHDELLVEEQTSTVTGIDWAAEFPDSAGEFFVAVSVLEGEDRVGSAARLVRAVTGEAPEGMTVLADPLELGTVSPLEGARMASEYFGADYLVYLADMPGDSLTVGVATPDSVLWTSTWADGVSFDDPVRQMMGSDALGDS